MATLAFNASTGLPERTDLPCGCWIEAEFNVEHLHYMLWLRQERGQILGGDRYRVGLTVEPGVPSERLVRLPRAVAAMIEADRALHALEAA